MDQEVFKTELRTSLYAGYIDGTAIANPHYLPKLLVNNPQKRTKVLTTIIDELQSCDEFLFSVAFVTNSGVEVLIDTLKVLEKRGIHGKILASQYQNFTEPRALRRLIALENVEVRIQTENNFHAKGYLFRHGDGHTLIVGSSNLTQSALCENGEWNLRVTSFEKGSIVNEIRSEFDLQFESATIVDDKWIEQYKAIYQHQRQAQSEGKKYYDTQGIVESFDVFKPKPNTMQVDALEALSQIRSEGKNRALLISATGTGKTFLSAFDASKFDAKHVLFVVHRENIARAALETFKRVFGSARSMGMFTGSEKDASADYIFGTIQTLSKPEYFSQFSNDYFDYIVIDEVHHSGAESYQRIIDYFKPSFMLGMSATPERNSGLDVFKLFDYNVAYEIRLQAALEQKMLTPFHYHGISDFSIDDVIIDDESSFKMLVSDERVKHIYSKTRFYGCDHGRIKGLIFCSRVDEAKELAEALMRKGLKVRALTGNDNEDEREAAIGLLESDDPENYLEYIITVDIFNEGVDIPCVNQVVLLRPTQSAIVFVQQLGRGLRRLDGKEYVVVLDFIGNYKKSFLIPMALSGDRSYNKDNVRKCISDGPRLISGNSTVEFDEIAKERIYKALDDASFSDINIIKNSYSNLKYRLGRIPTLREFDEYGEIDPLRIFENNSLGSYHEFLKKHEKDDYHITFTPEQEEVLKFISIKLASGKREQELSLLKEVLLIRDKHSIKYVHKDNVINVLTNNFPVKGSRNTYKNCIFVKQEGECVAIAEKFNQMLNDDEFYKQCMEVVDFGLYRNKKYYSEKYQNTDLCLYRKYTYEDVCRLLNWDTNIPSLNIGGYMYHEETKTYPVFINYQKGDDVKAEINYHDSFLTPGYLIAISKGNRTKDSQDVIRFVDAEKLGIAVHLFVRKNKEDKESKEFYYLGMMHATGELQEFVMENTDSMAVKIHHELECPVPDDLYEYITR